VSALSSASLSASLGSPLPTTSLPAINPALEPAAIRNGNQAAKNAYNEGLAFEDVLVNELAQEMTATVPGLDGSDGSDGSDSSDGSSDDSTGGLSDSGSALGPFASMLPQALTSSVMSGGGTGLAFQIARDLDPSLDAPAQGAGT
jgi:Rod binding domain-containing protein